MQERINADNIVKTKENPTILKITTFQASFNSENDTGRTTVH
jgi:hypothetical protein